MLSFLLSVKKVKYLISDQETVGRTKLGLMKLLSFYCWPMEFEISPSLTILQHRCSEMCQIIVMTVLVFDSRWCREDQSGHFLYILLLLWTECSNSKITLTCKTFSIMQNHQRCYIDIRAPLNEGMTAVHCQVSDIPFIIEALQSLCNTAVTFHRWPKASHSKMQGWVYY